MDGLLNSERTVFESDNQGSGYRAITPVSLLDERVLSCTNVILDVLIIESFEAK